MSGDALDEDRRSQFRALLARHRGPLSRLSRYYELDREARRDLDQEIALSLWQSHGGFRGEASERTWVLRVAHNAAVDYVLRASKRRARTAPLDDARAVARAASPDAGLELDLALREVRKLDLVSQQIVLLHLEGLTSTEIADVTGLSQTAVTTRVSRALGVVRDALAPKEAP